MADKKNIALAIVTSSLVLLSNGVQGDEVVTESLQEDALSYSDLGSGEEVRSDLVAQTRKTAGSCSRSGTTGMTGMTGMTGTTGMTGMTGTKGPAQGQCGEGKCGSNSQGYQSSSDTSNDKKGTSKNSSGK